MLYGYGMKIGAKLLVQGKVRQSLPYLIRPVNYWRAVEYRMVLDEGDFQPGERVLDIGSPKLLALYLAKAVGAEVFATDIDDYFVEKYRYVRALEGIAPARLHIQVEDGRELGFKDGWFDKAFSISVLEHIPEQGDSQCMREIARILAPGGRCLITVPFAPRSRVEYLDSAGVYWAGHSVGGEAGKVFYQRRYSEQDLFDRLIGPSGLALRKLRYVGENVLMNSEHELSDYLPAFTGPIQPLMSRLFHSRPVESWRAVKKPLCALIVLEKSVKRDA